MTIPLGKRIYEAIDGRDVRTRLERSFVIGISALIVLNVLAVILETETSVYQGREAFFYWLEVFSVGIFTAEYLLRLLTCTADPRFKEPIRGRLRFIIQPLSLVDLAAILPAFLPMVAVDLRVLRLFRFARFLRVLKIGRYSESLQTVMKVFRAKRSDLGVAVSAVAILLLVSSCVMYYCEHDAQPKTFSSIPAAMWWGVVTLTTVGYGDVYPVTALGKVIASVIALLSLGLFALPAGILASGFSDQLNRRKRPKEKCPHCGGELASG